MSAGGDEIGTIVGPLRVGKIAHGGHWVARDDNGRVIFVRGALEGELVTVRLTAVAKRHAFGVVEVVLEAHRDRVEPPCSIAADCGGCDFQHVAGPAQAELKRRVVAEQLASLAGIAWTGAVEVIAPQTGWRTRVRYHQGPDGWGMHPYRSHAVTPLPAAGCLIAAPALQLPPVDAVGDEARGVVADAGVSWLTAGDRVRVRQAAVGRSFEVAGDGFWQVHPGAADVLATAVLEALAPHPGERALDLYCGVGLFAAALAERGLEVLGIEGNRTAVQLATSNVPEATFWALPVERALRRLHGPVDLVVLDPPRAGAGRAVVEAVLELRPRAIAYVACDPAGLARDLGYARSAGWEVAQVRAFDLFGMTHHVECVALLRPPGAGGGPV